MKKHKIKVKYTVPKYAILPLICVFLYNCTIYAGTSILCKNLIHYDFTTALDRKVPFIEQSVIIYLLAYLFWIVNYILVGCGEKKNFYRFVTADLMSRTVCMFFYILLPTTNIRPELSGNSFCIQLVRYLYMIDQPSNLFPSIHCLVSWFCYIGIRKRTDVSKGYKIFSFTAAVLIMISTQTLKQHYLIDAVGGIIVAEVCLKIAYKTEWYKGVQKFFESIYKRVKYIKSKLGNSYEKE